MISVENLVFDYPGLRALHGGQFQLESALGAGTKATILLPAQRIASRHMDQGTAMGSVA